MPQLKAHIIFLFTSFLLAGCATESHRAVEPQKIQLSNSFSGPRTVLVVGKFQNRSTYMQGLFSSSADKLGNQAKTILKTHLQLTNRFSVVDRENMDNIKAEAAISGAQQTLKGAGYVVTGDVTEFGRKTTGDHQLFGVLGASKKQTAYAKVSLNVVNVKTSEIVYSTQGAGEYSLNSREVIGFGGTASYDATLNGKVLNFAIMESVNNLVADLNSGVWTVN